MKMTKKSPPLRFNLIFLGAWILLGLTLESCGASKSIPPDGKTQISDIVNGKLVTKKNENSYSVVAIIADKNEGQALCTGTIIAPDIILTAAHCVDDPQKLYIVFGPNVKKTPHENVREADRVIQHPKWNHHLPSGEADLALIHFSGELPNGYVPVKLAGSDFKLKIGEKILMMGYGVTDGESEFGAGRLRQTNSFVVKRHSGTEIVTDGQTSSVCFGDSGGPAFIEENNNFIQWGVASSVTDRSCDEASIHTEVMKYESWINSSMAKMH